MGDLPDQVYETSKQVAKDILKHLTFSGLNEEIQVNTVVGVLATLIALYSNEEHEFDLDHMMMSLKHNIHVIEGTLLKYRTKSDDSPSDQL